MSKRFLPEADTEEAKKLATIYPTCPQEMLEALRVRYGFKNVASFQTALHYRLGLRRQIVSTAKILYNKPTVIKADRLLVIADTQVPFQDADFLNHCLDLAYAWDIKNGISAGDFLNMTAFTIFIAKPEDKIWARERDSAKDTMLAMHQAVPSWLMLLGNHEAFLIKSIAEQFDMQDILALLSKPSGFTATDYYFCKAKIAGETWRVSHPRNISVIHGRVAQRLATKYHCNVISAHGHIAGIAPTEGGEHVGIDIGVTCEPLALDYASQRDTLRPSQNKGAVILIKGDDGKCHYYHITPNTDWEAMKRLYRRTV